MAMKSGSFDLFAADDDDVDEDFEENWDTSLDEIPFMKKLLNLPDLNKPPPPSAVAVVVPPSVVSDVKAAAAVPMYDCFVPFNFVKACTIDVDMDSSNHVSFVPDDDYQCQEKDKDNIGGTCEMNMAYEETPEAFFGPDSQPISSASPKRKYDRTTKKMKKHRPKVVTEGTVKKISIPVTPTKVTPRRATTKGSKPIKSKIVKNRKQAVAKSCKRVLMFDDTIKKALCTSNNISLVEEITSGLGLKREVESLGGEACGLAGYENGINIDLSVPPKLEIVKQSKPIQVYKRKFRCLIASRKVGPNFPTKRRSNRHRKFCCWSRDTKDEGLHGYSLIGRKRKRASLVKAKAKKPKVQEDLVSIHLRNDDYRNGAIVKYDGLFDSKKTRKVAAKVNLDEESIRMWNLLMIKDGKEDAENMQEEDKRKWWEDERKVFRGKIDSFIARMHLILGDRRFSRWKGSVVDSVVGVFLTQNVSDHLSSSAFMSLVAKYPISVTSSHEAFYEDLNLPITQESLRNGMTVEEHAAVDKTEEDMNSKLDITNEIPEQMSLEVNIDEDSTCGGNKDPNTKIPVEEVNAFSMGVEGTTKPASETHKEANDKDKEPIGDWDKLRKLYSGVQRQRSHDAMDSVEWNAVKNAKLDEVADTIKKRGQHVVISGRIKDFLNRVAEHHESIDLEWLRNVPEDDVKEFLLSIYGLGLKSVECIRLLALEHIAFPVDTNVGRIAVRLGWVPLQPLPEEVQIHLLNAYPLMDSIQKYLWPRLCKLDQRTLYELHYQMITFGKVFCTKRKPNCNPCPMRGECRHFASAFASARLALPGPKEKRVVTSIVTASTVNNVNVNVTPFTTPLLEANSYSNSRYHISNCEPIVEEPTTPEPEISNIPETDIEDLCNHDDDSDCDDIPTIKLNPESFATNILGLMEKYDPSIHQGELSKALVAINDDANSTSRPKLKSISRLRTQHQVFELPDSHPLLTGLETLEPDDPSPYLLAIWMPGDTANSMEQPKRRCNSQDSGTLCDEQTCFPCNFARQQDSQTVHGTLLIPCRTAMRGRFPLNGTYFQVNEVFSDYETSLKPLKVPTSLIWNLRRRTVYCGTSATSIFRDLSTEEIQRCFWRGYICVRGFDRKTRAPRPLDRRLHAMGTKKADRDD